MCYECWLLCACEGMCSVKYVTRCYWCGVAMILSSWWFELMCFVTQLFGRSLRILFSWLLILWMQIAGMGVTFLLRQFIMYSRKLSQIKEESVFPVLPSYKVCLLLIVANIVSLNA